VRLVIEPAVFDCFDQVRIGLLCGSIHAPRDDLDAGIEDLRDTALAGFLARGLDAAALVAHPKVAEWRNAYRRFGTNVRSHRPTHEALARRLLRDARWPGRINPIVDVYLTNQLTHLLPHGGYDLDQIAGALRLAVSPGGEPFEPLGGGLETTQERELVYRDDSRVLTRRWNFRDCDFTKVTATTTRFVLMLESAGTLIPDVEIEAATVDLRNRYERLWTGEFTSVVERLTSDHPSLTFGSLA